MKKIKKLLKNIVLSTVSIYSLNIILNKIGIMVPINYFSIGIGTILGFPGLVMYMILIIKYFR